MGQKYAAYDDEGLITAYYDSEDSPPPANATVIEITYEEWLACIGAPGYRVIDRTLVAPLPPDPQEVSDRLADHVRLERDNAIRTTDWLVLRHLEQLAAEKPTSLTVGQFDMVLSYRQALRDVPTQPGFPEAVTWPKRSL